MHLSRIVQLYHVNNMQKTNKSRFYTGTLRVVTNLPFALNCTTPVHVVAAIAHVPHGMQCAYYARIDAPRTRQRLVVSYMVFCCCMDSHTHCIYMERCMHTCDAIRVGYIYCATISITCKLRYTFKSVSYT